MILALLFAAAAPAKELTVLFMSNRQGAVAPCHCDSAPLGGVDRQVGAVAELREKQRALLVLDGGDNFFDTAEQAKAEDAQNRAELIADAISLIKPDVMFPGERDFLKGAPALRELGLKARASWLVSNITAPRERPPMVLPAHVAKFGDQKALVLGVYAKATFPAELKAEKYEHEDPVQATKRLVSMYRALVDVIIVMAHTDAQTEEKLAEIEGVTVVLSSHEGRLQFGTRQVGDAHIVSASKEGKYLVRLDLRYRKALPKLTANIDVQKFFREAQKKTDAEREKYLSQGLGLKDTLMFQLVPLSADGPSNEDLRQRAKTIDPVGYEKAN